MKEMRWILLGCLLVLMAMSLSCSSCVEKATEKAAEKALEKAIEKDSGEKVDLDLSKSEEGKFSVKSEDGEFNLQIGEDVKIPEDFPKDIPVYKGAKALGSMGMPGGGTMLTLKTEDAVDKVSGYYKKAMVDEGWKITSNISMGPAVMMGCEKDGRSAMVNIGTDEQEGGTVLSLMIAPDKK